MSKTEIELASQEKSRNWVRAQVLELLAGVAIFVTVIHYFA
ncbi:hypothetical protein SAMN06297129_1782 [Pseudooceanicola antarcticus]|uniref:Uncharacterized protein n=1 Tax=Pseudooceanicola antarcticus TaxID=1247613 RepID=A0A285IQR5_9RHOB|nr:hypothetical protein [Pseudooceanicola antarcticus]SNY50349.1 hypothetical protein SAMN06297129_1782 [Pseudooceanicola antarcticus]